MTDDERCPGCGALFVLVGRRHRCAADTRAFVAEIQSSKPAVAKRKAKPPAQPDKAAFDKLSYQREYMRKRRAAQRGAT